MNSPKILIISDKYDFACDYVCIELEARKQSYYRLNRDMFTRMEIELDVSRNVLKIADKSGEEFLFSEKNMKSIFFRAPIFLRDSYKPNITVKEQLIRSQWMSFLRNLIVFEKVKWVNHPQNTFNAESKIFQLKAAIDVGLEIPDTMVTNSNNNIIGNKEYIVKSLDVALFKMGDKEAFVYSNHINGNDLANSNVSDVPIVRQEYLFPKVDIRVTVIGKKVFAVKILKDGSGVEGDWRLEKDKVQYHSFSLPDEIAELCLKLQRKLGLVFGAIDLIESNGRYYFLEVNPTGEWAWLIKTANLSLHGAICDELQRS